MFTQDRENYFRTRMMFNHKLSMLENELIRIDELKSEYTFKYKSGDYYCRMGDILISVNSIIEAINEYSLSPYIDMEKYRLLLHKYGFTI